MKPQPKYGWHGQTSQSQENFPVGAKVLIGLVGDPYRTLGEILHDDRTHGMVYVRVLEIREPDQAMAKILSAFAPVGSCHHYAPHQLEVIDE